jgi:hypothetical protein
MTTHALLQKLPPEAWSEGDHYGAVDVLTVGSPEEIEKFLAAYRERHKVACREWKAWDDPNRDWDAEFDVAYDEICARHSVCALIPNVEFEIVPIGVNWYPGTRCEIVPQPVGTPDDVVELEADVARKDVLVGQVLSLDSIRST